MEYKRHKSSRRRRKRYSSSRRHTTQASKTPKVIFSLLLMGGVIYMLSASTVGTYLAENLVAPIFDALKSNDDIDDDAIKVSLSSNKNSVTSDITLPGTTLYTLQMGIYSSQENASKKAETLKTQGGAGYVLQDGDKFRVLSAGYTSNDDAKTVKDRLMADGIDCALFTLSAEEYTFKISTDKENTSSLSLAFSAFKTAQDSLSNAILDFDIKSQSISEGQTECNSILEKLKSDINIITSSTDLPSTLGCMTDCYGEYEEQLSLLSSSSCTDRTAFASKMKHTQLHLAKTYIDFSKSLSATL
ncbi:MAG: SPOR domain-containing protein [Clostridia bacterium]|nr:SPOR domain-containing protein [Clostridia bacterium]